MKNWTLTFEGFDPANEGLRETLCALGNGYFCTRGAAEWTDADDEVHYPGTYITATYNRLTTEIAGRPVENEDIVNIPNWLPLTFRIDGGDWFDLDAVEILDYRQALSLRDGVLERTIRFRDRGGRETTFVMRRLVSMHRMHRAGMEVTFLAHDWSGSLEVRSALDGTVVNYGVKRYRQLANRHLVPVATGSRLEDVICLVVRTSQSGIAIGQAARTRVYRGDEEVQVARRMEERAGYIAQVLAFEIERDLPIRVEKILALYTTRSRGSAEPGIDACAAAVRSPAFEELLRTHRIAWVQLWRRCDTEFEREERVQVALRIHIFHLLQTASRNTIDLDAGVPARGLHGEAYRGHVFWDELYIFPFLNFRLPEITQSLLMYRYRRLDEARAAARDAGYRGAMYPWQSGANGREETQTVHLNPRSGRWLPDGSHYQRHVNLAIAFNVWQYAQATGNRGFMSVFGAEMLLEIARFLASLAHYNPERKRYEIRGVMGPDEYHEKYPWSDEPGLANNAYTNVMTAWVMDITLKALDDLLDYRREELLELLDVSDEEVSLWADMSRRMYVPFHGDGIISQFERYDDLEEFDWDAYREKYGDIHRLDRILESEGDSADRYKVSKQADVLMLFYLFSPEEIRELFGQLGYPLDDEMIVRNIAYYEKRTSHGSTLSNVVHAAVTARYDRLNSWKTFCQALESDISDVQGGTTREGIHLGAMAGTVDVIQRCYTGLTIRDGILTFDPLLPDKLDGIRFSIRYRGAWLGLQVNHDALTLRLHEGDPGMVKVGVRDRIYVLKAGYEQRIEI